MPPFFKAAIRSARAFIILAGVSYAQLIASHAGAIAQSVADLSRVMPSIVMIEAVSAGRVTHGAGFVYGPEGAIASVFHVVDGAEQIILRYADGRSSTASLTAWDSPYDLALLRPDTPAPGAALPLARTSPMVGTSVVAVGNPFGHGFSVTAGIVSGHDRTVDALTPHGFLQHDAALNPGSSGGPLLTPAGEIAGINAAIPNGRRTDVGAGFAIPVETARAILDMLLKGEKPRHGFLGARLRQGIGRINNLLPDLV